MAVSAGAVELCDGRPAGGGPAAALSGLFALAHWVGGYWRWLRAPLLVERIWIRRGRCSACRRSHALLPDLVLVRRLDAVAVIGASLAGKLARGLGLRPIAEQLDVPHTTVRSWWQRFQARSPQLLAQCTALAVALDGTPVEVNALSEHAALELLGVAWQRARARFGVRIGGMWSFWSGISGGHALGPHTTSPWAPGAGADWRSSPMTTASAEATALFRYRVIAEAIGPRLSPADRGRLVRELARQLHEHPDGSQRQYSRGTLDRWIRAYASRAWMVSSPTHAPT
jgi:hypothetical protein